MRQKLSSRRGASLLIALLYFLVCGLVAAVIIGAAMTNVQKLKGARQRQQAYDSVSSAAQLIRDEMTRVEYQGMERWDEYECNRSAADIQGFPHGDTYSWEGFSASKEAGKSLTALLQPGVEKGGQVFDRLAPARCGESLSQPRQIFTEPTELHRLGG